MELHKALRNIVQTDGQDILKEVRLVNILDDFQAYQDIPASKYILRAIIVDGFSTKLMAIGKWDTTAEALVNKFSTVTGFIPESVSLIFQSIAFGLGWIVSINNVAQTNNKNQSSANHLPSRPVIQSPWRNNMTADEKEEYVFSLLEYDDSKENHLHVKLENLSFDVDENEEITIQCEIRRIGTESDIFARLHYALYDLRGRMKDTGMAGLINNEMTNPRPVSDTWWKLKASQLSKIRLFWES